MVEAAWIEAEVLTILLLRRRATIDVIVHLVEDPLILLVLPGADDAHPIFDGVVIEYVDLWARPRAMGASSDRP